MASSRFGSGPTRGEPGCPAGHRVVRGQVRSADAEVGRAPLAVPASGAAHRLGSLDLQREYRTNDLVLTARHGL